MRATGAAALGLALALALAGCGSGDSAAPLPAPAVTGTAADTSTTAYDAAVSTPVRDSIYPDVGSTVVDALHYDLHLQWDSATETLNGQETVLFRAAQSASTFSLDLEHQLTVGHVWLDGKQVAFEHRAKDLVVKAPVRADDRHRLQVTYSGVPQPIAAPTDRADFSTTGWTTTPDGGAWTMQEPYGAYSWYAVNDQPADKAFYDFTISAPAPMVGIANGTLTSRVTKAGRTTTTWHLPEPAASYLTTIAIGRYTHARDTGPHGLPISYWVPTGRKDLVAKLRFAPKAIAYLETKLGRYPYPTLGLLAVPGQSAVETQSMVTFGINQYTMTHDTIVHELSHQWYGDLVTPDDWSDLWMSEGMALYLSEGNWTADHTSQSLPGILAGWSRVADRLRTTNGPPAAYDPSTFAEGNAYYIPALMWDTIRQHLGDPLFWRLVRTWPQAHRFTSQSRADLIAWWSKRSGQDLAPIFQRWLLGAREPAYHR